MHKQAGLLRSFPKNAGGCVSNDDGMPITSLSFDVRLSRVEFDLVSIAILSVVTARNRMMAFLSMIYEARMPGENLTPSDTELTVLFNDAWIIIDRLNTLKKVLGTRLADAPDGTNAAEFRDSLEPVVLARNGAQHIDKEIIARKTSRSAFPLLGIITAVMFDPVALEGGGLRQLDHVVLSHSEFHAKLNLHTIPERLFPLSPPVDHIRLHAFGQIVNLSRAVALAEGLTDVLQRRANEPPGPTTRLSVVITQQFDPPLR